MFERMYDVSENASLHFVGYMTDNVRYDFAIVYTDHFFGKPLVVCMQSGRSATLCSDDLHNLDYLQRVFNLSTRSDAEELAAFLEQRLNPVSLVEQF